MDEIRRPRSASVLTALLFGALLGCAPSAPLDVTPGAAGPRQPSTSALAAAAELLRLEDRREFDAATIETSARAPEPSIRARAALAAGRIGTPASGPLVRSLLEDEDTAVVAAAAFVAGQLRDSAAVEVLAGLLDPAIAGSRATVAAEAAAALGKMSTPTARTILVRFLELADTAAADLRLVVREALIGSWRADETAVAPYLRWLDNPDPEIRWRAAYALTRRPRPEAVSAVLPLVDDSDPLTRSFAVRGLGASLVAAAGLPRQEALGVLIEALEDEAYPVRIEAIRTLGTYSDEPSLLALGTLLTSESPHEVAMAIESLGRLGPAATAHLASLRQLLEQPSTPVYIREVALAAIAAIEPERTRTLLDELASHPEWRLRAATARALAAFRQDALPSLEPLARDADPRVATAAIEAAMSAVGAMNIARIRPLLLELLQSPDVHVRAAALRGMSLLGDPASFPTLLDAYDRAQADPDNDAALAALEAIADLRLAGLEAPERAFFIRFPQPVDATVHQRAIARFRDAARAAWGGPPATTTTTSPAQYGEYIQRWQPPSLELGSLPRVRIDTELGPIDLELFGHEAPLTVANFLDLARDGYFDGQEWPRVIPNFVVQGGDPRGDTSGGPGYTIRDELNRQRFQTGTLAMALSGPDTGGSQFFISHSPQPHLDGGYTVFGQVLAGQDVVERLLPGQRIISVREITEE